MIGRRSRSEQHPLTPANTPIASRILRTYELLGVDPDHAMLVGSAAMALYGITPSSYDPVLHAARERPSDLDLATDPLYMSDVFTHGTATGLSAIRKFVTSPQTVLRVNTPEMPVDLITRFRDGRNAIEQYSARFMHHLSQTSRPIDGSELRVITPTALLAELARNNLDPKAASDLSMARDLFNR